MKSLLLPPAEAAYQDPAASLNEAAAKVGVELGEERLATLVGIAQEIQISRAMGMEKGSPYNYDELQATRALPDKGRLVSDLHFQPSTFEVPSATTAQPKEATKIGHRVIQGLQNYALLVDAGIIARPDILLSETNPRMARVAQRLGFSATDGDMGKVNLSAPFEVVHDAVFSPEALALDAMLTRRLATMYEEKRPPGRQY